MNHLPTLQALVSGRPLLLYLVSNSQVIGALLAHDYDDGNEQTIYFVSKTLKDIETRYPRIEKNMSGGYLRVPKAKTILLSPPDPLGD